MSMRGKAAQVTYKVLGVLLLVLLSGFWAYLWVH
jgi:hypothetical protein